MTTPIAQIDEIAFNQANKFLTHNEAIRILEALHFGVVTMDQTTEPVSPTPGSGQAWIVGALVSPAGAWGAFSQNDVVIYNAGDWHGFTPWEGLTLWVNDLDQHAVYDGTQWQTDRIKVNGVYWIVGTGSPEGVVAAPMGSIYTVKALGSPNATSILYVKESDASPNNTGWVGK